MLDVSRLLIYRGSDLNSRNAQDDSPLHAATAFGHSAVARLLVDEGAEVDLRDKHRWTPLHWASSNGDLDTVAYY